MNTLDLANARITGTAINYLFVCHRKLWFFQNHIEMEHTSDNVALGQLLHEQSYGREKRKEMLIDDLIRIDFIDKDGVLHDVKSGRSMEKAHQMQILYYLYLLKQKGLPNLDVLPKLKHWDSGINNTSPDRSGSYGVYSTSRRPDSMNINCPVQITVMRCIAGIASPFPIS